MYRLLRDEGGFTQRTIARLAGQSQSEVSEILAGRRVLAYDLLVRIAEGLGIPRELMGLSYGQDGTYGDEIPLTEPPKRMSAEMMCRHLIALSAIATFGGPAVGELVELLRRYSNRPDLLGPLVSVLRRIKDPAEDGYNDRG